MSKENSPGFLSKVARFVRKPLTNWNELDQPEPDKSNDYSKALLKEMIERKRRNDFVRKREFDHLRKLRSRHGSSGAGSMAGSLDAASFFHTSLPSNPSERADTLRKIDEIEAQMSQQWWKSRAPGSADAAAEATRPQPVSGLDAVRQPVDSQPAQPARAASAPDPDGGPTIPAPVPAWKATAVAGITPATSATGPHPLLGSSRWLDEGGGASALSASTAEPGFMHDPELEEPAILFANADYQGAEAALMALLAPGGSGIDRPSIWLALFDLYRACGLHERFDSIAVDFASRFGRSAPVWFALTDAEAASGAAAASARSASTLRAFGWNAPESLTAKAVELLAAALAKKPLEPWRFTWSKLQSIEPDARAPLLQLLEQWARQPIRLRFGDAQQLEQVLAEQAPAGDATVAPLGWRLRLELLRLMGRADAFDQLALDYCITYEVSPPSWVDPACTLLKTEGDGGDPESESATLGAGPNDSGLYSDFGLSIPPVADPLLNSVKPADSALVELSGQLIGDSGGKLEQANQTLPGLKSLTVRCDRLARVDFSAAGSVLNWAAARQADGCRVEFSQLQRLVAIFFNVVGINEYARVSVRNN